MLDIEVSPDDDRMAQPRAGLSLLGLDQSRGLLGPRRHEAGLRRSLLSEMAMRWTVLLAFLRVVFRCALLDPTRGQIALCGMWPSCPARINRREPAGGPSGR